MIKLMAILIGLFLFSRSVFPADETNQTPPAAQASAVAQRVSAFAKPAMAGEGRMADKSPEASEVTAGSGARLRDPFWPIGFFPASMSGRASEPAKSVGSAGDKKTAFQAANLSGMLRVGGVVKKGNKFYATINGFTVQTGEVVSVVAGGEVYRFVVEGIDFNKVQFKPVK